MKFQKPQHWKVYGKKTILFESDPSGVESDPVQLVQFANGDICLRREERPGVFRQVRALYDSVPTPTGWQCSLHVDGVTMQGEGSEIPRRASKNSGDVARIDEDALCAKFPGKVKRIVGKPGQEMAPGEPILVLEAMKMEFVLSAPAPGVLVRLLVVEGEQVRPGQVCIEFEAVAKAKQPGDQ